MGQADRLEGHGVQPGRWSHVTVCPRGMVALDGAGSQVGGWGVQSTRWLQPTVRLCNTATPDGAGSQARGIGSPSQPVVAAYVRGMAAPDGVCSQAGGTWSPTLRLVAAQGALAGDGNPQWHGLTSWGDNESNPSGSHSSRCAFGRRQPLMARAHKPGGQRFRPSRWSKLRVCPLGHATPNGAGSQSGGTESPAPPVLAAHGALVRDGSPLLHGLTGSRDGESKPAGRRSSQCACGGWRPPMARAHKLGERGDQPSQWSQLTVRSWVISACDGAGSQAIGTESPVQLVVAPHGGPVGLLTARAHTLRRRKMQPMWWWQLTVCLRGMAAPDGASSQAVGTDSPA